jgi:uncharacterized protein (TIGR02284 family)
MIPHLEDLVEMLNKLIQTCKDDEIGYLTAESFVENMCLKTLFNSYAQQRSQYAAELQEEVRRLGGQAAISGSMAGAVEQGRTSLSLAESGSDEGILLADRARGEERAKKAYQQALEMDLPPDVQAILERHYAGLKEAHDRIAALEPAMSET